LGLKQAAKAGTVNQPEIALPYVSFGVATKGGVEPSYPHRENRNERFH